jgi:hypothetical protein
MVSASVIPVFVAELARLYFEAQGHDTYKHDPEVEHVVVCGDINTSRLKTFLSQFFHKSRDPEIICPVVILAEHKYEGPMRLLIEQARYAGDVRYIRGSARNPADLRRVSLAHAASVIILSSRGGASADDADSDMIASCLAIKAVNKRIRIITQIRRPRTRDHLMCLPGWKDHDRAVAIASLAMTLVGVGSIIPGLPTLLTNLIHQGNKGMARSVNPRRRKFTAKYSILLKATMERNRHLPLHAQNQTRWYMGAWARLLEVGDDLKEKYMGERVAFLPANEKELWDQLHRPMSPLEEYTAGFAQEMFAFLVTPGLANRSFGAAARIAYLRYSVLIIGVRVPAGHPYLYKGGKRPPTTHSSDVDALHHVLLYPADLILETGMYLHAIGFDTIDLAAMLQGTGGEVTLRASELGSPGNASPLGMGRNDSSPNNLAGLSHIPSTTDASNPAHVGVSLPHALPNRRRHNVRSTHDLSVPWCFCEQDEEHAEMAVQVFDSAQQPDRATQALPPHLMAVRNLERIRRLTSVECTCQHNEEWFDDHKKDVMAAAQGRTVAGDAVNEYLARAQAEGIDKQDSRHSRISEGTDEDDDDDDEEDAHVGTNPQNTDGEDEEEEEDDFEDNQHDGIDEDADEVGIGLGIGIGMYGCNGKNAAKGSRTKGTKTPSGAAGKGSRSRRNSNDSPTKCADGAAGMELTSAIASGAASASSFHLPPKAPVPAGASHRSSISGPLPHRQSFRGTSGGAGALSSRIQSGFQFSAGTSSAMSGLLAATAAASVARSARNGPNDRIVVNIGGARIALAPSFLPLIPRPSRALSFAANQRSGLSLSPYKDHILILGMTDRIGLLLRAIRTPAPFPPRAFVPGQASLLSKAAQMRAEVLRTKGYTAPVQKASTNSGKHVGHSLSAWSGVDQNNQYRPVQIVIMCPHSERPSEAAMNAMYAGSSRFLSKVALIAGSPVDMGDLLRAGVETARAAIILSTKKPTAGGNDNLSDDVDAIVTSSSIYKLNPSLHIMTEVLHGPDASYLRPCGTNLVDAEESTSAFVSSVKLQAVARAKQEAAKSKKTGDGSAAAAAAAGRLFKSAARAAEVAASGSSGTSASSTAGIANLSLTSQPSDGSADATVSVAPARTPLLSALSGLSGLVKSAVNTAAASFHGTIPGVGKASADGAPAPLDAAPEVPAVPIAEAASGPTFESPIRGTASDSHDRHLPPPTPMIFADATHGVPISSTLHDAHDNIVGADADPNMSIGSPIPEAHLTAATPTDADSAIMDASTSSTGAAAAEQWQNRMARERIRLALSSGDSVGRTAMANKALSRPDVRTLFGAPVLDDGESPSGTTEAEAGAVDSGTGSMRRSESLMATVNELDSIPDVQPVDLTMGSDVSFGSNHAEDSNGVHSQAVAEIPAASAIVAAPIAASTAAATNIPTTIAPAGPVPIAAAAMRGLTQDAWSTDAPVVATPTSDPYSARGSTHVTAAEGDIRVSGSAILARAKSLRLGFGIGGDASAAGVASPIAGADLSIHVPATVDDLPVRTPDVALGGSSSASRSTARLQSRPGLAATDGAAATGLGPSEIFGAPAFAAGRAFSSQTIDALMCEAHFAPHVIFIVKQLVRASRKQRLQLLPIRDAIAMAMLVTIPKPAQEEGGNMEDEFPSMDLPGRPVPQSAAHGSSGTGRGRGARAMSFMPGSAYVAGRSTKGSVRTYAELFEALLRGWHLLPVGLYRRLEPGVPPTPPTIDDPAQVFADSFVYGNTGAFCSFRNEKALLSYVFTNPGPGTVLNEHDFVYVLRPGTDVGNDAFEAGI